MRHLACWYVTPHPTPTRYPLITCGEGGWRAGGRIAAGEGASEDGGKGSVLSHESSGKTRKGIAAHSIEPKLDWFAALDRRVKDLWGAGQWDSEGWHSSCERETIMERPVHFQSSD